MRTLLLAIPALFLLTAPDASATSWFDCEMTFDLESWALFYKEATGAGLVRCNNGQHANVRIISRGGGLAFGRSQIVDGVGRFSKLRDIREVFGTYGRAETSAGAGNAAGAQILIKGDATLAIAGTGRGFEVGIALGSFTIQPR